MPCAYTFFIYNISMNEILRNTIAHYNIRDYKQYKTEYLCILELFEKSIL